MMGYRLMVIYKRVFDKREELMFYYYYDTILYVKE